MNSDALQELGLSQAEAKVYLALLENGLSKSGSIIKSAKLQSSTVYHVLESLVEKGLASYVFKGEIKYFQAEKPESFLYFLDEKARKFKEMLPELKALEKKSLAPRNAKVFEGIRGLKSAYNDILHSMKKGEEYCFFQVSSKLLNEKSIFTFLRAHHMKRSAKGVRVKGLAISDARESMQKIFAGLKHARLRYVESFLPTGLVVYKDKVITLDLSEEPSAFLIQSQSVADSYKKFFEERWKTAKTNPSIQQH